MKSFKFKVISDENEILLFVNSLLKNQTEFVYEGINNDTLNKLDLSLPIGITKFKYKDIDFTINNLEFPKIKALQNETIKHKELYIFIKCENDNEAFSLFKNFIDDACEFCKDKKDSHVSIYTYITNIGWSRQSNLPKRNIDSIYINDKEKDKIINDIKKFYASKEKYLKYGVPYKRVYLFEGPPGTGKTSLIFSLASLFDKNLSTITFDKKIDDSIFASSMRNLQNDSMLLLEDIDALFNERISNGNLSFSAMLNTLDGVGRRDEQIIFMTTNHINKLDDALKRPGRIDYIFSFNYPSIDQIKTMFNAYFPNQQNNFQKFYDSISDKVTIALLQKFMFDNLECDNIIEKLPELDYLINFYNKFEGNIYL